MSHGIMGMKPPSGDHVFDFCGCAVRARNLPDQSVMFRADDVCAAVGIEVPKNACARLDQDEVLEIAEPVENKGSARTTAGRPRSLWLTESGLYSLILGSRKPEAKRFKKWVTSEVLPEIRKRGYYSKYEADIRAQTAALLQEHFPGLPGPSRGLFSELIQAMLERYGWSPSKPGRVPAKRANPPWSRLLAKWSYEWGIRIEGQQPHRRMLNPNPCGSRTDTSMLSDLAESSVREVCRTGVHFTKIAPSWEDWRHKMEIAFGTKPLQLQIMVPLLRDPETEKHADESAEVG